MADFSFSKDQQATYNVLNRTGKNVFLTGGAGTGKSTVLTQYINSIKKGWDGFHDRMKFPVLGSTGVSAMLIGGRTFHSYFGLGMAAGNNDQIVKKSCANHYVCERIRNAEIIFIDEISMIPARLFSIADEICRMVEANDRPFGDKRVIICGDYLQLPPVTKGKEIDWAFNSMSWSDADMINCGLKVVHRTGDYEFNNILNKIRVGTYDMEVYNLLKDRVIAESEIDSFNGTRLLPFRANVLEMNLKKLKELPGDEVTIETEYSGEPEYHEATIKSCPVGEFLSLKEGALVMFRVNDRENRYVNGSLGTVVHIGENTVTVEVDSTGDVIDVGVHKFEYLSGSGNILGTASNLPLSLAWASTIHKSQGATIDRVCVDLRGTWEGGQSYVALSRVKSREGLHVIGWGNNSIKVNQESVNFYEGMKNHIEDEKYLEFYNADSKRTVNCENDYDNYDEDGFTEYAY